MWILLRVELTAIGLAVGLALAALVLIGLALAAIRALTTIPVAGAVGTITLAAAWTGSRRAGAETLEWATLRKLSNPFAIAGVVAFAAAAAFAVHESAVSATADAGRATSLAIWAYPSNGQLRVGAQQPPGHGATSLRIVVTHAGITAAAWNQIHLAAGQTWEAPPLTLSGNGPTQVVASRGAEVIARLSVGSQRTSSAAAPAASRKSSSPRPGSSPRAPS
jgi:hypothetical protein